MAEKQEKSLIPNWSVPSFLRNFPLPFEIEDFLPTQALQNTGLSVYEDKGYIYVEAAVPGLNPKDIDITFEKGVLWIHGEKKEEEQDKQKKFYRKASSSFSYRIAVPGDIDEKKEPTATYKEGVMKIAFPKSQGAKSKKIQIKAQKE